MDPNTLCAFVAAGVLLQLTWMLYPWSQSELGQTLVIPAAVSLLAFIPGKHETYSGGIHILLPRITEGTVVLWTGLGLCALACAFGVRTPMFRIPCVVSPRWKPYSATWGGPFPCGERTNGSEAGAGWI